MNPFDNPLYVEAQKQYNINRAGQIAKGYKEYGQAYNPLYFTADEQMEHFMSEVPDIVHYGYGMYMTIKRLEDENRELRHRLASLEK
jgi:hypothetical protein